MTKCIDCEATQALLEAQRVRAEKAEREVDDHMMVRTCKGCGGYLCPPLHCYSCQKEKPAQQTRDVAQECDRLRAELDKRKQVPWLSDLMAVFGWQGGTVHQAIDQVKIMHTALSNIADMRVEIREVRNVATAALSGTSVRCRHCAVDGFIAGDEKDECLACGGTGARLEP